MSFRYIATNGPRVPPAWPVEIDKYGLVCLVADPAPFLHGFNTKLKQQVGAHEFLELCPGSVGNLIVPVQILGVGNEIDVQVTYDYTEDVSIGANVGWFFTGDAFADGSDDNAQQALVNVNVNF